MSFQDKYNADQAANRFDGCHYEFRKEAVEDRNATIETGRVVYRDRDICEVFKIGGNGESVIWIIEELPPEKMQRIAKAYAAWKEGEEAPVDGTDLKMWPLITEAERRNLAHFKIRTVEDLSILPDNMLPNIGLGGRALRDKAKAWLSSATDNAKLAQQVAALNVAYEQMKEENAEKDRLIADLKAQLPEKRGPGRPRKADESEAAQ